MRLFVAVLSLWLLIFGPVAGMCQDLIEVKVERFTCDGDQYRILYSVSNKYTYNRNPTIAFRVERDGDVVGCARETIYLPSGSQGSELREITIDGPCNPTDTSLVLKVRYFMRRDIDRMGYWMSGCP